MSTASEQPVASSSSSAKPVKSPRKPSRAAIYLISFVSLIIGLVVIVQFCYISGEELNPANFQVRSFLVYRIPGTQLQFLPTFRDPSGSSAPAEVLRNLNPNASSPGWHIVKSNSYGGDAFPASLLQNSLSRKDTDWNPYWDGWSKTNPKLASVLWPTIQSMAIGQLYTQIPETLRFAEGYQGSATTFEKELLTEVHRLVQKRKAIYETASDRPTGSAAKEQGIPEWNDVQKWLDAHPIP